MEYDIEFERVTENVIFICRKCHARIIGGKNIHLNLTQHKEECECNGYDYVMPGDKFYTFIKTYRAN